MATEGGTVPADPANNKPTTPETSPKPGVGSDASHVLLDTLKKDLQLSSLRDYAVQANKDELLKYVNGNSALSGSLGTALFMAQPTGFIQGMVNRGELLTDNEATRTDLVSVLKRLDDNALASAPLKRKLLEDARLMDGIVGPRRQLILDQILRLGRLQSFSPTPAALVALWTAGASSAAAVSRVSLPNLEATLPGLSKDEIAEIKRLATFITQANRERALNIRSAAMSSMAEPTLAVGNRASRVRIVREKLIQYGMNPDLESLLGPLDYRVINENQTVYSPTAYFVDLLHYLQVPAKGKYKFDNSPADVEADISGTVLQRLHRRRPDLLHMDLSADNTTTILPYIDLVNEVLESFVVHLPEYKKDVSQPRQNIIDAYNVNGRDSEDLLSQPQNFKSEAYRQLASAVYPTSLPYHQPLDAQRAFLSFLGVTRAELVKEFRPKASELIDGTKRLQLGKGQAAISHKHDQNDVDDDADERLVKLQERALRAQEYCEVLGLCQEEFLIWTKGVFWQKEHFAHTEGLKEIADEAYRRRIGLKDPWQYWGYKTIQELMSTESGASLVKAELLPRLGIKYADLIEIIQTRFCNPYLPTGRDKLIVEALHLSYRHLQLYTDTNDARSFEKMAQALSSNTQLMRFFPTDTKSGPIASGTIAPHILALRNWLAKHFALVGRMAVLEKGEGPKLRITGDIYAAGSRETTLFGTLTSDGLIRKPSGERVGSVDVDGLVSYGAPSQDYTLNNAFPDYSFTVKATDGKTWQIIQGVLCKSSPLETNDLWVQDATLGGTANIDHVRLVHLDGSPLSVDEWDRIHVFTRVWRTLAWSVQEVDRALNIPLPAAGSSGPGPSDTPGGINADVIHTHDEDAIKFNDFVDSDFSNIPSEDEEKHVHAPADVSFGTVEQLAAIKRIVELTGVSIEQILTLWTPMTAAGPRSQYDRLFNRRNLRDIDNSFKPDNNGNYFTDPSVTITSQRLTVIAALNIRNTDLDYLLGKTADDKERKYAIEDKLNLKSISQIYSYALLARILSVKINDLYQIFQGFGSGARGSPCRTPAETLDFLERWRKIVDSGIPWSELRFIVDSVSTPNDTLALTQIGSLKITKQLVDGALAIQKEYGPGKDDIETARTRMGKLLDDATVEKVVQLLQGTISSEAADAPYLDVDIAKSLNVKLAELTHNKVTYFATGPAKITATESKLSDNPKGMLKVCGILSDREYNLALDAVRLLANPDLSASGMRRSSRRSARSSEAQWKRCFAQVRQNPITIFQETLMGVLPASLIEEEISGVNRNILAPDYPALAAKPPPPAKPSPPANGEKITAENLAIKANGLSTNEPRLDVLPRASSRAPSTVVVRHEAGAGSFRGFSQPQRDSRSLYSYDDMEFMSDEDEYDIEAFEDDHEEEEEYQSDTRTPAFKIRFFLEQFTPFLQRRLTYNSIVETLASVSGFSDADLARTLLESVITPHDPQVAPQRVIKNKISELLEKLLPQTISNAPGARSTSKTGPSRTEKIADMTEKLYANVYDRFVNKRPGTFSLIEEIMSITQQKYLGSSTLLDQIVSLAPAPPQSAIDFVLKSVSDSVNCWQGYFVPPESVKAVFIVTQPEKPEDLRITEFSYTSQLDASLFLSTSGRLITFKRIEASGTTRYESDPVQFNSDKKYAIRLPGSWLKNVNHEFLWRTSETGRAEDVPKKSFRAWWKGYLCPSIHDVYSFAVSTGANNAVMILNNDRQTFTQKEGQAEIWSSELSQKLDASSLNTLELHGCAISDLKWKIGGNQRSAIPETALLPDLAPAQMYLIFLKMKKLALFFKSFPLGSREVLFMRSQGLPQDVKPSLNFDGIHNVQECIRIQNYLALKKALPTTAPRSLIDLFSWADDNKDEKPTQDELRFQICSATSWPEESVSHMLTKLNYTTGTPKDFRDAEILARFQRSIKLSQKLDVDIATLIGWASPMGTASDEYSAYHVVSQDIQRIAKSRFDADTWVKAVRPINNKLREKQSQSLVSYLLVQEELTKDNDIHNADDLFEYFLIDVQMTSLMETSRVVQATSSVQLFIQRCFLGLEEDRGVPSDALDRKRWTWMEKYRVWEANRKIFLYPENWIDPALRDNKTPQFQELESELMQKNLSSDTVDTSIRRYVSNVANISNVQAVAMYVEKADGDKPQRIHVFARTIASPFLYLYNNFTYAAAASGYWAGWEEIKIEIPLITGIAQWITVKSDGANPNPTFSYVDTKEVPYCGSHLAPYMFRGRLLLFTLEVTSRAVAADKKDDPPEQKYDIRLSWTERRDGVWTTRKLCPDPVVHMPTRTVVKRDEIKVAALNVVHPGQYALFPSLQGTVPGSGVIVSLVSAIGSKEKLGTWLFDGGQLSKSSEEVTSLDKVKYTNLSFGIVEETSTNAPYMASLQLDGSFDTSALAVPRIEASSSSRSKFDDKFGPSIIYDNAVEKKKESFYNAIVGDLMAELAGSTDCKRLVEKLGDGIVNDKNLLDLGSSGVTMALVNRFGASSDALDASQLKDTRMLSFNERSKLYSIYNWELGLHIPMLMADKLLQSQQYEAALKICQLIFDPSVSKGENGVDARRCWKFAPFRAASTASIEDMFVKLATTREDENMRIKEWSDHPFLPHLVARSRPQAYMRWVVSTYIKILIAWGDSLFKQETLESIPQAIQLYVLASHVYGPRGQPIPQEKPLKPETFWSLCRRYDPFSNALVELEQSFPYSNQTPLAAGMTADDGDLYQSTIFGSAETLYFAIPDNPNIRALADTIDDRLFKIRHSQDINGVFRKLPLFAPPIDPALLVQAAAQGLSLGSVLQDLQGPLPNCKLTLLLSKAFELISEVRGLGQALLSIREKKDFERLAVLRQRHEVALQKTSMEMKNMQLKDAQQSLENLQTARNGAVSRLLYYLQLVGGDLSAVPDAEREFQELDARIGKPIMEGGLGLSSLELSSMENNEKAHIVGATASGVLAAAGILEVLPQTSVQGQPLGVGITTEFGSRNIAAGVKVASSIIGLAGEIIGQKAGMMATKAGHERALQERVSQANAAGHEVVNVNKQIISAKIRVDMAQKEIAMQQQQMDQSEEISTFLREKYSTADLYGWMDGVTKTLYHQYYTEAFALAKKAELAYRYERPQKSSDAYIQAGYFDSAHDGLLAGENLFRDLKRLERAYLEERGHSFEVTKSFSLRMLDPAQLLLLRQSGKCEIVLPELLFDMDFPGQYMRRIKSVSVTVPCVVGPHTALNGTLTLTSSEYRISSARPDSYTKDADDSNGTGSGGRFASVTAPISAISVSNAQNDSGVFQLDFSDSSTRYLPFEGAGAISKWTLELPKLRQFDYETIFDVVLQMRYTALFDGGLKDGAHKAVVDAFNVATESTAIVGRTAIFDIRAEYATAWATLRGDVTTEQELILGDLSTRLPFFARQPGHNLQIKNVTLSMDMDVLGAKISAGAGGTATFDTGKPPCVASGMKDKPFGTKWTLSITLGGGGKPRRCLLLVEYRVDLSERINK